LLATSPPLSGLTCVEEPLRRFCDRCHDVLLSEVSHRQAIDKIPSQAQAENRTRNGSGFFGFRSGFFRDVSGRSKATQVLALSALPQRFRNDARKGFLRFPSWTSPVRPRSPALQEPPTFSGVRFSASLGPPETTRSSGSTASDVRAGDECYASVR
jgi:hypothetical protein